MFLNCVHVILFFVSEISFNNSFYVALHFVHVMKQGISRIFVVVGKWCDLLREGASMSLNDSVILFNNAVTDFFIYIQDVCDVTLWLKQSIICSQMDS